MALLLFFWLFPCGLKHINMSIKEYVTDLLFEKNTLVVQKPVTM